MRAGSGWDPGPDPALIKLPSERRWRTRQETAAGDCADGEGNGQRGRRRGAAEEGREALNGPKTKRRRGERRMMRTSAGGLRKAQVWELVGRVDNREENQ